MYKAKIFKAILLVLLVFPTISLRSYEKPISLLNVDQAPFIEHMHSQWVDSLMTNMSLDEKIGQLFMVAAYSNKSVEHKKKIESLIKNQKIGGLIFFQGGAGREIDLTNHYQKISKTPLLIAGDWEWGLAMRLDSTVRFPRQMMLGAIQNEKLIYDMGAEIAHQIKLVGGHINFAPVVDINNNPKNPVIGSRSFGENRDNVTRLSLQYMKALQDNQVLAVAKHFPGHGDTDVDSHHDLPIIPHDRTRLDSVEFFPYGRLFRAGLGGVMVSHLYVPELDSTKNMASTLSKKIVTDVLRKDLGFKGVTFTDALNMKGVSKFYKPGEINLMALLAGNDILLYPKDVPNAIAIIRNAVKSGVLSVEELDAHVRKILALKYWAGLDEYKPTSKENITEQLNREDVHALQQKLIENALTVVSNKNRSLPLKNLEHLKIASVGIGDTKPNEFQKTLKLYTRVDDFRMKKFPSTEEWKALKAKLDQYNMVIFSFHKTNRRPNKNFALSEKSMQLVENYAKDHSVIVNVFANPYALKKFKSLEPFKAVVVSYNNWNITQKLSAEMIFGAFSAKGRLPVSINELYPEGSGSDTENFKRLKYTTPKDAGVDHSQLYKIDSIVLNSIREKAFPGCQVLAAKDGKVFYNKSFGHFTYDKKQKVTNDNLYDLASITKVLSTVSALMKLDSKDQIDVSESLSTYYKGIDTTNKANLKLEDILTHQAKLKPWIPFYLSTIKEDSIKERVYRSEKQGKFSVEVAEGLFIDSSYRDTILKQVFLSDLRKKNGYRYSDLGYYMLQNIIEDKTGKGLAELNSKDFYKPIGANHLVYNPLNYYPKDQIVPTELDDYYRNQLVQGYVHDMGSAMLGGVGGHAGLFANANDVAKMMQMFLNEGYYGGRQFIPKEIVKTYTSCPNCPDNRRGIGFDKAEKNPNKLGPTCDQASASSFGHTGFTGTITWVDPENGLLYVFLSNRIYPKADNNKLIKLHTRTKIQEVLYNSIL
jgi:beta-glucosidase-like glycosyl hydrolase/CubicO group peptidase (beta-lactamase class C family)